MGKRARMVFAALAVAVPAVPVWILYPEVAPEPAYAAESSLSFWLVQLQHGTNQDVLPQAQVAVYQIGSRAVPRLLRMLRAHDSALRSRMLPWLAGKLHIAYNHTNPAALYPRAWCGSQAPGPAPPRQSRPCAPACIKMICPNSKARAAMTPLANIGPAAGAAVPSACPRRHQPRRMGPMAPPSGLSARFTPVQTWSCRFWWQSCAIAGLRTARMRPCTWESSGLAALADVFGARRFA